jgi:hypothetical protein
MKKAILAASIRSVVARDNVNYSAIYGRKSEQTRVTVTWEAYGSYTPAELAEL